MGKFQEELKTDEERALLLSSLNSCEEEVKRIKMMSRGVRQYEWAKEQEVIHQILLSRLSSLITIQSPEIDPQAVEKKYKDQEENIRANAAPSGPDESEYLF